MLMLGSFAILLLSAQLAAIEQPNNPAANSRFIRAFMVKFWRVRPACSSTAFWYKLAL